MNKLAYIPLGSLLALAIGIFCLVDPAFAVPSNIVQAEYFIDADPGEGSGNPLSAKDGSFDSPKEDIELSLDTSNLKLGVHALYIRMQNEQEIWGTPRKILFDVTGDKNISAAECFFDGDPGPGNGSSVPPLDGSFDEMKESITAAFDTSGLSAGLHTLACRMKDSEDHWGTTRGYTFEVREPPVFTGAEYYIDDDPGIGNGTPLDCSDGNCSSHVENLEVTFSACGLSAGAHTVFVRGTDSYFRWGEAASTGLEVTEPVVDCECDLNHDGRCDMQDWLLFGHKWGRTDCNEPGVFCDCDVNYDCKCDMQDWLVFGQDWGRTDCP